MNRNVEINTLKCKQLWIDGELSDSESCDNTCLAHDVKVRPYTSVSDEVVSKTGLNKRELQKKKAWQWIENIAQKAYAAYLEKDIIYEKINNLIDQTAGNGNGENNVSGSVGNCLENQMTLKPFFGCSDEAILHWQLDKNITRTNSVSSWIDTIVGTAYAAYLENGVINKKLTTLDEKINTTQSGEGAGNNNVESHNCLEEQVTISPYAQCSDEAVEYYGLDKNGTMINTIPKLLDTTARAAFAAHYENTVINDKVGIINDLNEDKTQYSCYNDNTDHTYSLTEFPVYDIVNGLISEGYEKFAHGEKEFSIFDALHRLIELHNSTQKHIGDVKLEYLNPMNDEIDAIQRKIYMESYQWGKINTQLVNEHTEFSGYTNTLVSSFSDLTYACDAAKISLTNIVRSNTERIKKLSEQINNCSNGEGGNCLEQEITTQPYLDVSDEAIVHHSGIGMSRDSEMTRTVTGWIGALSRVAYAAYSELPVIKQKFVTMNEKINGFQTDEGNNSEPTSFEIRKAQRVDGYMEFYDSQSYEISKLNDLVYAVEQSEAALTQIISSNIMKINNLHDEFTALGIDNINNKLNSIVDLNSDTNKYLNVDDDTTEYLLKDFPIYLYNTGSETYDKNYGTFGCGKETFGIHDALHTLIRLHNLTQHHTNIIMDGFVIPVYEDVDSLKTRITELEETVNSQAQTINDLLSRLEAVESKIN